MKVCSTCKTSKEELEFNKNKRKKDGFQTICRECQQKHSRDHYANNTESHKRAVYNNKLANIKVLQEHSICYLQTHPCIDCGEDDIIVLEYDHVRGEKRAAISYMIQNSYSLDSLIAEIKKCEVRCANCHKRKSARDLKYYKMGR